MDVLECKYKTCPDATFVTIWMWINQTIKLAMKADAPINTQTDGLDEYIA
jgi:hypothetical protein